MRAIDAFAGPGGWSQACKNLGIIEDGIELDKDARATRDAAGFSTVHDDVRSFEMSGFYDGLIASPPCPTFSQAGKGQGREEFELLKRAIKIISTGEWPADLLATCQDDRTALCAQPLRLTLEGMPLWVAFEQVPTVLPVWEAMGEAMSEHGYHVWTGKVHAEQYGTAQTRTRAVLLARLGGPVGRPEPTHSKYHPRSPERLDEGVNPWISMAECLGWGMTHRPAMSIPAANSAGGGPRFMDGGSGARRAVRAEYDAGRWTGKVPTWVFNRPSPTIVGSFRPEVVAAPGWRKAGDGPRQNTPDSVIVEVWEAGLLQDFPQDFPWQGARTKKFQQVGNAVPVRLAEACIREVTQ